MPSFLNPNTFPEATHIVTSSEDNSQHSFTLILTFIIKSPWYLHRFMTNSRSRSPGLPILPPLSSLCWPYCLNSGAGLPPCGQFQKFTLYTHSCLIRLFFVCFVFFVFCCCWVFFAGLRVVHGVDLKAFIFESLSLERDRNGAKGSMWRE